VRHPFFSLLACWPLVGSATLRLLTRWPWLRVWFGSAAKGACTPRGHELAMYGERLRCRKCFHNSVDVDL
jgi:hypothetical protein